MLSCAALSHGAEPVSHTELTNDSINLEEIFVTGRRLHGDNLLIPQFVKTVESSRIEQMNPQTTADMLASDGLLSVQKSQQGGGSPSIRGFESSRVLLVVDGVRMNNLIYRAGHLQNIITIDPSIIGEADVMYGPASVAYGSDALGGVISFHTKMPRLADGNNNVLFSGSAFSRFSSANDESTWHADFNIGGKKFASFTSLSYSKFGDLRAGRNSNPFMPDGDGYIHRGFKVEHAGGKDVIVPEKQYHQPQSGYHQYDLMQKFMYSYSDNVRHLLNFQFSNTNDVPRYDRLTDMKGDKPKFAQWYYGPQQRLLASYTYNTQGCFGADNASLVIAYQNIEESRNNRKFNDAWLGTRKENVNIVSLSADWIKYLGVHKIHAGIDGSLQYLKSTAHKTDINTGEQKALDTRYPDGHNHMHNIDLFVAHSWEITPRLVFSDGLRVGYSTLKATFNSDEFFPFFAREYGTVTQNNPTYSINAGLSYNVSDSWKLALSLTSGYRVPNIDDLAKVFDSQPGMVVVPNPGIKPEKTISADFNVAHVNSGLIEWDASVFGTYIFDAIALAPATVDGKDKIDYDGELSEVYANRNNRRAFVTGITSTLKVFLSKYFRAEAAATYTYG
ncbi:MAG: TonB-dependent receptor, partial [Muribaculaceae bacterium]|nr:TonB-dependent receptor [Muribaculaceae bacterium]